MTTKKNKSPLSETHPELAVEWDFPKNHPLTPDDVRHGSNRKIFWKCPNGHGLYELMVYRRVKGTGCSKCKSLGYLNPEAAALWHPTKNTNITAFDVTPASAKKVWWKCGSDLGHSDWQTAVYVINRGSGCPECAIRVDYENSLASRYPEVAKSWSVEENAPISPAEISPGTGKKYYWTCLKDSSHDPWLMAVKRRIPRPPKTAGVGCPECANKVVSYKNSLEVLYPEVAASFHPTLNGNKKPSGIKPDSNVNIWWQCLNDTNHEPWKRSPKVHRNNIYGGCKECNSLEGKFPDLAASWDTQSNGDLLPSDIPASSHAKVWWRCSEKETHPAWEAQISERLRGRNPCPVCSGRVANDDNSLATLYPELAKEWASKENGSVTPALVTATTSKGYWWKCRKGPDHIWKGSVGNRTKALDRSKNASGCPYCYNKKLSITNALSENFPEVAAQWHPSKNGDLTPDKIIAYSKKKYWWKCDRGPDHEWSANISTRSNGAGCPFCAGYQVSVTNSLANKNPEILDQWDFSKNGELKPTDLYYGSSIKVWWKCQEGPDHEWQTPVGNRKSGTGCPFCAGQRISVTNTLASLYESLATEWHPTKNGSLTPNDVVAGSTRKVWWQCPESETHEWEAQLVNRINGTGCPFCNHGWTIQNIRLFIKSLIEGTPPIIESLSAADLYLLFQQSGLGGSMMTRGFIRSLSTGRFPTEELEKFVAEQESLVDDFVSGDVENLEDWESSKSENDSELELIEHEGITDVEESDQRLPEMNPAATLKAFDSELFANTDEEAVEYLISSGVDQLWQNIYKNQSNADEIILGIEEFLANNYGIEIQKRFLKEYKSATNLEIPKGYTFKPDGEIIAEPNLMQRHVASLVRDKKRVGNWSGTGAGKTLSAILASRVISSSLTVVCCPNSVVEGWDREIRSIFPDSEVLTKTWNPRWENSSNHRYLIMNYEQFQLKSSAGRLKKFLESHTVNFVVVDEIHYAKQASPDSMSRRREMITAMVANSTNSNPDLHVLGMSATPVINNLTEGRSLIELITTQEYVDLKTTATISNAMSVHQHLKRLGMRWMPDYSATLVEERPEVDCSEYLDEIRSLGKHAVLPLERILTEARLPSIRANIKPKTLIYSMYIGGIDRILYDALTEDGWKVGFYTGEDKSGLDGFINGDIDVLIGTSSIGTGVDGLQKVCNQLIINVMPWTAAEYEQLKGRIHRQGQTSEKVTVIIPTTYANIGGERWSWCESKWERVKFKKSLADAAVDGVVPEGHLRSPNQAYSDAIKWLDRLDDEGLIAVNRPPISIPLVDSGTEDYQKRVANYGDFSNMNARWNSSNSSTTHERLKDNPEEWEHYHSLYREARKDWTLVPFEEMFKELSMREGYVVGDFGCGEAILAEKLSGICTVHSFDHVSSQDYVTDCDLANVPLDDEELDVAVFSLSLMGRNFTDYIKEAHRTLKLDGRLHIYEATSRFSDVDAFVSALSTLGFGQISVNNEWKFTHVIASKDRMIPTNPAERLPGLGSS